MRFSGMAMVFLLLLASSSLKGQSLEVELKQYAVDTLVDLANREGDPARGGILFFHASMSCAKCHATDASQPSQLGPTLAQPDPRLTNEAIVEAILEPSKSIRPGFESAAVLTTGGDVLTGLLVARSDEELVLRDSSGVLTRLAMDEVEQVSVHSQSLMPAGQVNQLTSRQQFLDLLKYLFEIRDGGAVRARELQPAEALLAVKIPDYESHIDHAGIIRDWGAESFARGEAIYRRVCANCHGTKEQLGSLPTSLRFAEGRFKNGSDPLSIYGTLTRGFGFMPAQSWMVPSQKYDVIHYLREEYLKPSNVSQLTPIDDAYMASLPRGDTRGPEPSSIEVWSAMDYGSNLTHCYEVPGDKLNIAYKGIAVRLDQGSGGVSRGEQWMVFDTDTLRVAAGWRVTTEDDGEYVDGKSRFIDWRDIQMNGEHGIHPRVVGEVVFRNSNGPGWADPTSGSWVDDRRVQGRDQRWYGPLPRDWGRFRGLYHHGGKVILSYTLGGTELLELPGRVTRDDAGIPPIFLRTFNIGPRTEELVLQVAETGNELVATYTAADGHCTAVATASLVAGVVPASFAPTWSQAEGKLFLRVPAGSEPLKFTLWLGESPGGHISTPELGGISQMVEAELPNAALDLARFTQGGPARWAQKLETPLVTTSEQAAWAVDLLTAPQANPWLAQLRFSGLDFFQDGSMAVCTWDGDVWHVRLDEELKKVEWQRIATGLYQPLGLKIVNEKVYLTCRDQLAVLHDLNGDGETDYYECLNNDHQVTEHFHEFAMGLQVDEAGNFYYAKSGRHALEAVVPHHGTLLRVTPDGERTEIIATGFRAANGVCLNPDGSFVVTDQEGFWNPKNRINWVTLNPNGKPNFYGNMFGYHDVTDTSDSAMEPPLCWITNQFDRSPGELLWVDSPNWKELNGGLLNLSYGTGKVFWVLHEQVAGVHQGGMIELPIPTFPTGVMRGRFSPVDEQLYLCGMFAWAGNATSPGGLYRLRAGNQTSTLPLNLQAKKTGLYLTFAQPLDSSTIKPTNITIETWSLKRTKNYGSNHYDQRTLPVTEVELMPNGKTVHVQVDGLSPTWCMEIKFDFRMVSGEAASGVIHNTIHNLGD